MLPFRGNVSLGASGVSRAVYIVSKPTRFEIGEKGPHDWTLTDEPPA